MTFSEALKNHIAGIKLLPGEIDKRKAICGVCPKMGRRIGFKKAFPWIGLQPICNMCGCYLDGALGKWAAAREECPDKKW